MKKIVISVLTYVTILLLANTAYATEGTVNTETARMRSEPETTSSIIELISMSEKVEILEESGDWYKIKYNGKTGYISKSLLTVEEEVNESTKNTEEQVNTTEDNKEEIKENTTESTENVSENTENSVKITEGYTGNLLSEVTIKIVASINSTDIAKIEANTQIVVIEILNDWCYIQADSYLGWARVNIVENAIATEGATTQENVEVEEPTVQEETQEEEQQNEEKVGYVNVESVNVRKEKSTSSEIIDSLTKNTEVTILGEEENWYKVKVNGITGYIATKYISDKKVAEQTSRAADTARTIQATQAVQSVSTESVAVTTSSTASKGAEVVQYAKQFLGTAYVSGGSNPSTGFDCSGFTSYVYKHFGISLSRSSSEQAKNGTSVSKDNLQLGDIVVFRNNLNTAIGHVGIYIGGNEFIHAANGSKGVVITSLSTSYYQTRYVEARRVL